MVESNSVLKVVVDQGGPAVVRNASYTFHEQDPTRPERFGAGQGYQ